MAKSKPKSESPFTGTWHIMSMAGWDEDYINEEVQAYMQFDTQRGGGFHFGYVQGNIDYRTTTRDGKPAAEFSWDGMDGPDCTPLTGRGWAVLQGDELHGMFFIHLGDESDFVAKRADRERRNRRK